MITKKELIREIQNQTAGNTGYNFLLFRKLSRGYEYERRDSVDKDSLPPLVFSVGTGDWNGGRGNNLTLSESAQILKIIEGAGITRPLHSIKL